MANIHDGHRSRVRARVRMEGMNAFHPHEVIELLLMQVIPRGDVNPTAHELIARFGSVQGVLGADTTSLCSVPGVGQRSATFLRAFGELAFAYASCPAEKRETVAGSSQAARLLAETMGQREVGFALLCLDSAGQVLHVAQYPAQASFQETLREMVKTALSVHAVRTVTAQSPVREPSTQRDMAERIHALFCMVEIAHMDHIIFAETGMCSALREGWF